MSRPRPEPGITVTHRRYVPYSHAHYAGGLVDGAYGLGLFGDVATELCISTDGDEVHVRMERSVALAFAPPGWASRTTIVAEATSQLRLGD